MSRLAASFLLLAACCAPPTVITVREAPTAEGARVWRLEAPDGSQGSGFPIRCTPQLDGSWVVEMLTAGHVAEMQPYLTAHHQDHSSLLSEDIRLHDDWDAAVVTFPSDEWIRPHDLDLRPLRVGTRCYHAGYHLGTWIFTEGFVCDWNLVSSSTAPGGSGGPVFDDQGRVVAHVIELRGDFLHGYVHHMVVVVPLTALADWL